MRVELFRPDGVINHWFYRFGSCGCGTCAPEQRYGFGLILPRVVGISVGFGGPNGERSITK